MLEPALLFAVVFGPLAYGCIESWSRAILEIVLFSLPLLATAKGARRVAPLPKPVLGAFAVLLAVGAVQALNPASPDGPLPLLPFSASTWHTRRALLLWTAYAALLWAAPRGFSSSRAARRFSWAVVLIGFAVAAIGLMLSGQGGKAILGYREITYGMSPFGTYYNNGHAASLFAISTMMGLGLLASGIIRALGRARPDAPRVDTLAVQVLLAFMIGIIVVAWLSTSNRGSALAFGGAALIVGFLSCGFLEKSSVRWAARAAVVVLFLSAVAMALHLGILRRGSAASVPVRLSMYVSGLRLMGDAPLWGTGLGTVITVFAPYKEALVEGVVDHVHNDWLELPLEVGVPVAALILAALGVFGWRVYWFWIREPSLERRLLIGGGLASALCFLLHAMVEFTWQIPANAVIFLLILSWLWGQTHALADSTHERRLPPWTVRFVLSGLSVIALRPAVAWLLMKGARYDAAYTWDANPAYLSLAKLQGKPK